MDSFKQNIQRFLRFVGPGFMISIGYMDPGNWATDLQAGSQFGYKLLYIILISNLLAIYLQYLALKLGIVAEMDLAQACRSHFHPYLNIFLYIGAEIAIVACDLAEVIGSAVFRTFYLISDCSEPVIWSSDSMVGDPHSLIRGIVVTSLDVFVIIFAFRSKFIRYFEASLMVLVFVIALCYVLLLTQTKPYWPDVFYGYLPIITDLSNPTILYNAMGIVGATVMPHNLYLHSHLVQYRSSRNNTKLGTVSEVQTKEDKEDELKNAEESQETNRSISSKFIPQIIYYSSLDSLCALSFAFLVNSFILIVAASQFFSTGQQVSEIQDAYNLLKTMLGLGTATIFAIALLCSGQSSTITGTIAGQIVMEGFLGTRYKIPSWVRRLTTRAFAIVPALIVATVSGPNSINNLLILSQVVLSIQLPFAVWPLIYFTNSKKIMTVTTGSNEVNSLANCNTIVDGSEDYLKEVDYSNCLWVKVLGYFVALLLTGLNIYLLTQLNNQ